MLRELRHSLPVQMEDVGVAYGFNNLPRTSPNKSATIGAPLPVQKLSDIVRHECAYSGWTEVMPLILCSHDENFAWLNREDDGKTAVKLANPKSAEYQVVRTSLLPGLLKTIRENKSIPLPLKIFETSDVVVKDDSLERRVSLFPASLLLQDAAALANSRPSQRREISGIGALPFTESHRASRRFMGCSTASCSCSGYPSWRTGQMRGRTATLSRRLTRLRSSKAGRQRCTSSGEEGGRESASLASFIRLAWPTLT